MDRSFQYLITALMMAWELPQTMLGLLVFALIKGRHSDKDSAIENHRLYVETLNTGVSLGLFVFWTPEGNRFPYLKNDCRMHEYGHARQSLRLGPLYLFLIGIPSLSRVIYRWAYYKITGVSWKKYYYGYPENWADILGGVRDPKRSDIYELYP